MKNIVLIGSGGHARSLIDLLKVNHFNVDSVYDAHFKEEEKILDTYLKGNLDQLPKDMPLLLAIGDNTYRKELFINFKSQILKDNIIHPSSIISSFFKTGFSNNFFARTVVNSAVEIGDNNIINTGAILEHEVKIGSHNHISVGSTLLGRVTIGDNCFIGASAVIADKITICGNVTIGANSFVKSHIKDPGVYVGNPVRKIR